METFSDILFEKAIDCKMKTFSDILFKKAMDCKKCVRCADPINLQVFGMPDDICFGCYNKKGDLGKFKDEIIEKNVKAKTQPMDCPCCEAKSHVTFDASILRDSDKNYKICCSECSIQTESYKTEDEAIEVWNTRPNHNKVFRTFPV